MITFYCRNLIGWKPRNCSHHVSRDSPRFDYFSLWPSPTNQVCSRRTASGCCALERDELEGIITAYAAPWRKMAAGYIAASVIP